MVLARGSAFRPCSILAISDKLSSDLSATSCCDKCAASRSVRSRYAIFLDSPIEDPPWRLCGKDVDTEMIVTQKMALKCHFGFSRHAADVSRALFFLRLLIG